MASANSKINQRLRVSLWSRTEEFRRGVEMAADARARSVTLSQRNHGDYVAPRRSFFGGRA